MRSRNRRDWIFGACSAALVPLLYLASFTVFESSDAFSSTGGRSVEPVDGVRALQDLDGVLPVGSDAFFSLLVLAEGAATEAPLDRLSIEVRNEARELVSGTTRILDQQPGDQLQSTELLIGWEADARQSPEENLTASILLKSSAGDTAGSRTLHVTDASASLTPPDSELRDWVHELRDYGGLLTCGTGVPHTFGADVGEFMDATLALSTPPAPVAVAWKYTLEATALAAQVDASPESFFVQGPPYAPVEAAEISFTDQAKEYCIRVVARDLRTDLEYSDVFCGAPDLPLENVDSIGDCRLDDLQGDALRARWCRTKPESACQPAAAAQDPAPASQAEHRTSEACALTRAPKPDSGHAVATWAIALLVAARARRRRAHTRE